MNERLFDVKLTDVESVDSETENELSNGKEEGE